MAPQFDDKFMSKYCKDDVISTPLSTDNIGLLVVKKSLREV
jgi:hypothetical protein